MYCTLSCRIVKFYYIGQLIAMSISQEGSGFPYFSQSVYQYLCGTNPLEINACLLSELNAFEASTSRTASVSSHSNKFLTA